MWAVSAKRAMLCQNHLLARWFDWEQKFDFYYVENNWVHGEHAGEWLKFFCCSGTVSDLRPRVRRTTSTIKATSGRALSIVRSYSGLFKGDNVNLFSPQRNFPYQKLCSCSFVFWEWATTNLKMFWAENCKAVHSSSVHYATFCG